MRQAELCRSCLYFACILFTAMMFQLLPASFLSSHLAAEDIICEDFQDLADWQPLSFKAVERHSQYSTVRFNGGSVLKLQSNSSASGIVQHETFEVFKYPVLSWRWRVESVYAKGNATEKSGDDYPLRIYVLFPFDPEKAGLGEKITFGVLKTIYGEYPPRSTLNYIWANRQHKADVLSNPYTDRAKMIPVQFGSSKLGQWITQSRNILQDYRRAFGQEPPPKARLALMNDSDNTEEASVSYLDWICVSKERTRPACNGTVAR